MYRNKALSYVGGSLIGSVFTVVAAFPLVAATAMAGGGPNSPKIFSYIVGGIVVGWLALLASGVIFGASNAYHAYGAASTLSGLREVLQNTV